MSITGTGTQADPYIVETYEDLKTAVEYGTPEDTYIKFKEPYNIDLPSIYSGECPSITYCNGSQASIYIDGNGTTISGYSSSWPMFYRSRASTTYSGYFGLKNINLHQMYVTEGQALIQCHMVPRLENVRISGITSHTIAMIFSWPGSSVISTQDGYIKRCAFAISKPSTEGGRLVIFGDRYSNITYPSELGGGSYIRPLWGCPIVDCKIDVTSNVPVVFCGAGGNTGYSDARKTNFLRNTIILHGSTPVYWGWLPTQRSSKTGNISFANTVIRGNSTGSIILKGSTADDEFDAGVCVVDHTALPNATLATTEGHTNPFNLLTAEEIKNPAYLRSIGFECGG